MTVRAGEEGVFTPFCASIFWYTGVWQSSAFSVQEGFSMVWQQLSAGVLLLWDISISEIMPQQKVRSTCQPMLGSKSNNTSHIEISDFKHCKYTSI